MCGKKIKDLKDVKCFFKNILWMLSGIHDGIWAMVDEGEEGEGWKHEV